MKPLYIKGRYNCCEIPTLVFGCGLLLHECDNVFMQDE